ncbi:MAG: DUF368 domain-containing protein [Bacilli bacterium]
MIEKIKLFIKGVVLGLAFIIPGVSGGTLAFVMGIYDKLIEAISHLLDNIKSFKKHFLFLFIIGIGILLSVVIFSKVVGISLDKFPLPTLLLFVGLVIGSIPSIFKNVEGTRLKSINCLFFAIGIIIVLGMSFMNGSTDTVDFSTITYLGMLQLFLVGCVASATMVIPGISGSFVLMILGYYKPIIEVINNLTSFTNIGESLMILIPFGVGIIVGIILIAKLIEWCLKKFKIQTFYTILGFVIGSIVQLFVSSFGYTHTPLQIVIGFVLLLIGAFVSFKVFKKEE